MGNDPPVLPSSPGEPPLQRAGLRGGTCGRGEQVVVAQGRLGTRGLGMRRDGDRDALWGDPSVALHPQGDTRVPEGIPRGRGGWVWGHVPGWMAGDMGGDAQVLWCVQEGTPSKHGLRGAWGMWGTSMGTHLSGEAQGALDTVACPGGDNQGTRVAGKAMHPTGGHPGDAGDPETPLHLEEAGGGLGTAAHPGGDVQGTGRAGMGTPPEGTSRGYGGLGWGHVPLPALHHPLGHLLRGHGRPLWGHPPGGTPRGQEGWCRATSRGDTQGTPEGCYGDTCQGGRGGPLWGHLLGGHPGDRGADTGTHPRGDLRGGYGGTPPGGDTQGTRSGGGGGSRLLWGHLPRGHGGLASGHLPRGHPGDRGAGPGHPRRGGRCGAGWLRGGVGGGGGRGPGPSRGAAGRRCGKMCRCSEKTAAAAGPGEPGAGNREATAGAKREPGAGTYLPAG